jgi:hypothetical protein
VAIWSAGLSVASTCFPDLRRDVAPGPSSLSRESLGGWWVALVVETNELF